MTPLLLFDAIDAATTIWQALLAWIVAAAVVATIVLIAAAVTGVWVWRAVWRACRTAWRGSGAPHRASGDSRIPKNTPEPAQPRLRPPPTWAQTDKEAA